jgi:hypothetical protein
VYDTGHKRSKPNIAKRLRVDYKPRTEICHISADDGAGRNSPFTAALLKHIATHVEIGTIMRRVCADVIAATLGGTCRAWRPGWHGGPRPTSHGDCVSQQSRQLAR